MELSRVAEVENAKINHVEKIQAVNEVDDKYKVVPDEQYKKVQGDIQLQNTNEVILDNVKFGYNEVSKDFFVKVTRGEHEYKYPTEEMMKVKAQLLYELEKQQEINKN